MPTFKDVLILRSGLTEVPVRTHLAKIYDIPSHLSQSDITQLAGAVLAAAQVTPIHADVRKILGQPITGAGTESNPWGPA